MVQKKLVSCFLISYCIFLQFVSAADQATRLSSKSKAEKLQNCALTVGWGIWPPYQYLSSKGEAIGLQIDLLNDIAAEAQCSLNYVQQPFSRNISDLEKGKIDMMADTTVTADRRRFAYFSEPYRSEILILYVKKENLLKCKDRSLKDIMKNGFKLGLTRGNLYGKEVQEIKNDQQFARNLVLLNENRESVGALLSDRIDGYFEDPTVQAYELKKRGFKGKIESCRIEIYAGEVSLMFSKRSVEKKVIERFNQALKKIKETKSYKNRWDW